MTRDEFVSLPLRIALGIIYDIARTQRLVDMPMPDVPKPPLYDTKLSKGGGGFVWMSEMALADLEWWRNTKQKSADGNGDYADRDRKSVATLEKWIAWRVCFPSDTWSGKRGEDRVSGAPPSRNPTVRQWGPRSDAKKPDAKSGPRGPALTEHDANEEPEGYGF